MITLPVRRITLLVLAAAALTGCQSSRGPEAFNVHVRLADELRDPSGAYPGVDVFFLGVTDDERRREWEGRANVDEYARYRGSSGANQAERVLRLGANQLSKAVLGAEDRAWTAWSQRGARHLVVIANYPRTRPPLATAPAAVVPTSRDPRYLVLPLARDRYPDINVDIDVTRHGLELRTPPHTAPNRR